ncbi:MAG: polynucleotide adenylyltransferase [Acidobacteria bacterium]|nr:polynucleotide adenylyltransferase [Acidobacteriota bacterium]
MQIARAIGEAGGRALVVGGWVRDRILEIPSKDIDIEVYGIAAPALRALLERFGRVDTVGEQFTVFKMGGLDVALPRRESRIGHGHRGFDVQGDPSMSIAEASRRRDFTINAISWDPLTGEYLDPCHGREDLDRRILRAVDASTFGDDSLRVLRALQFAARFDLLVEDRTRALCRSIALDDLPGERVFGEIEKLLLWARRPSVGFALGLDLGVIARVMPEMAALVGCRQEPEWHPEGDVWVHTLMVIDHARVAIDDLDRARGLTVMLGAVCHDFGKPATTALVDGRIRSPNHEPVGVPSTLACLDRLNVHTVDGFDARHHIVGLVAYHLAPGMWHKAATPVGDGAFRRLAQKVDLELLARLARADCRGRTGNFDCSAMDWFVERARALGVEHRPPEPLLKGRHLLAMDLEPGPRIGRIVKAVYERQLDGSVATLEDAIAAAREILSLPSPPPPNQSSVQ